jgi:hypothetical protein
VLNKRGDERVRELNQLSSSNMNNGLDASSNAADSCHLHREVEPESSSTVQQTTNVAIETAVGSHIGQFSRAVDVYHVIVIKKN